MANVGGVRPGAGRPKGAVNKVTHEQREAVLSSGLSPLEFMLRTLRDESLDFDTRMDAAKNAAPYVHARLAAQTISGPDGGPIASQVTTIERVIVDPNPREQP